MRQIDKVGEKPRRKSRVFKLVYHGKYYSPKYVIYIANEFSINRKFLAHDLFYTYETMAYLKGLGFNKIIALDGDFEILENLLQTVGLSDKDKCRWALEKLRKIKSRQKKVKSIEVAQSEEAEFIALLKKMANFKCQFHNSNASIETRKNSMYVEVAHIQPLAKGGKTYSENLLILCPNHHKEFDLGDLVIKNQNKQKIQFVLNSVAMSIAFIIDDL